MTFIVIADLFTPAERGRYQGLVGAVFGIASVLGPLIGGLLTDHAGGILPGVEGWRWVFYVNVPIGGLALWFIARRMPRLEPPGDGRRPDLIGAALLLGGLVPLILSLQIDKIRYPWLPMLAGPEATPWEAWGTVVYFVTGLALSFAFVLRSRSSKSPILDLSLFGNRVFSTANQATFFMGASFMSVTIFLPLFLVNVLGVSATRAGAFLYLVTAVLLATMGSDVPYWRVTVYMVMAGLGVGPGMPLFTLAIQNAVDVRFVGQATSASQFFRQTGATVGAALMGTVLGTTLGIAFASMDLPAVVAADDVAVEQLVSTGGAGLPARIRATYDGLAAEAATPARAADLRAEGERRAVEIAGVVREAFARATSRIYWLTSALLAIATMLSARIPELPLRTTHDRVMSAEPPAPAA
jgi:hypothetical protein